MNIFQPLRLCGFAAFLAAAPLFAVTHDPLGPFNRGGERHGVAIHIGDGGTVYELDAFVYVPGEDLNGSNRGVVARLSTDALPTGLVCVATNELLNGDTDLVLAYEFRNEGLDELNGVRFFSFLDAEIDEELNTFFNEYGEASGSPGTGSADPAPDFWQLDEPGFGSGSLMTLLLGGALSQSNAVPVDSPDDVSMALGFELGRLRPGEDAAVSIMISEDGTALGSPILTHRDVATDETAITYSGTTALLPDLTNVIVSGPIQVAGGTTGLYDCVALFTDATTQDVTSAATWLLLDPGTTGVSLAGNVLHTPTVQQDVPVKIAAVYAYRGVTMTGTLDITVVPLLTNLVVTGTPTLHGGDTVPYTATAYFLGGMSRDVTVDSSWILGAPPPAGMSMSSNSLQTVPVAGDTLVSVEATYTFRDVSKTGRLDVTVQPVVTGLSIMGRTHLRGGEQAPYQAIALLAGGFSNVVTTSTSWSVVGTPPPGVSVVSNVLQTAPAPGLLRVTLQGVSEVYGNTVTGRLEVSILTEELFLNVTDDVDLALAWRLDYSTGALIGTLTVDHTGVSPIREPFHLGMARHADFFYTSADGELPNGTPYMDLSTRFAAALAGAGNGDAILDPGETVRIDGIYLYSRDRSPPAAARFELWAHSGSGSGGD